MTFDVYVVRCLHEDLEPFEERYFDCSEAIKRFCYYSSTGIPVLVYGENSEDFSGELLMLFWLRSRTGV